MASTRLEAPIPAVISANRADLCLDFANTRYWRGTEAPTEVLQTLDDVFTFLVSANALDPATVDALKAAWPRDNEAADLAAIIHLREALYRLFVAAAKKIPPHTDDLARVNRALREAPPRSELTASASDYLWRVPELKCEIPHLLAPILWTAGDMLAEPRRTRVRLCANDKCVWLFLDDSKSGTRRWCDMKACGNRAKAHRHYEKKRQKVSSKAKAAKF
jgi:predicted RNA-binding Zn ribbon-like protein